ncbi:MAG: carotenoid biosynthesis protein, partial [Verrucomicrobiota bacterium]
RYIYTDAFGPRIGPLPLAIPLAWIVIVLPLLRIACRAGGGRFLLLIGVPLATVAVDLLLEPVAWDRRGYWIWLEPTGFWYGVPELNFFGWFATSLLILLASLPLLDLPTRQRLARPAPLSVIVPASVVGIFSLTATVSGYLAASILGFILLGLLLLSLRLKKRLKN